jgi:alpha-mannosidase
VHDDSREVLDSVERLLRQRLLPAVHRRGVTCEVAAYEVAGEPIPVADALAARYVRVGAGHSWGRPWGTTWLRVSGAVPRGEAAASAVLRIDLGFDGRTPGFQAEGLVFDTKGEPLKGVAPLNAEVPLALLHASPGEQFVVFVEAASNPDVMGR